MPKNRPKVLLITNCVPLYRQKLYERLGSVFELTIAHFGPHVGSDAFTEVICPKCHVGPLMSASGAPDPDKYDVVIVWSALRLLEMYRYVLRRKRNYKVILFGPGVASSYTKHYDADGKVSLVMKWLLQHSDAAIFYDHYPLVRYSALGVSPEKLFVAYNTIVVDDETVVSNPPEKSEFVFVGTIYKEKGILLLLNAYKLLIEKNGGQFPHLNIIGDGPDLGRLKEWVSENQLNEHVFFRGRITDENQLRGYFSRAMACVSPKQAGLSVQQSFAFGAPFLTEKYPITGGEFSAVIDNVTGFLYDGTLSGLCDRLENVRAMDKELLSTMSENCRDYYERFRSPSAWVRSFEHAVQFVLA